MRVTYSLYEAKAKLSAIVRMVREGRHVVVTVHGKPVVEMRPIRQPAESVTDHLDSLAERGVIVRQEGARGRLSQVARRPGALKRFLEDRD